MAAGSMFCGRCGGFTRPQSNTKRRVCPRCHPEKIPEQKPGIDKTGMPCKDRGVCRPERCIKALECEERMRG